jgi:hypothetical protein
MANLYTHVAVIEGAGGGISTTSELFVEYLCSWCGERLGPVAPVTIEDVDPL